MRTFYIAQLQKLADAATKSRRPAKAEYVQLETQIQQLMASLPENQRKREWSMADLVARLTGKYRARPHPMKVAEILRMNGWRSHRDYSRGGGGVRLWRCPASSQAHLDIL